MKRVDKLVAEAKQKEFDRLKDYALNQMSLIECGLNVNSVSRNPYAKGNEIIWVPSSIEITKLSFTLLELRDNILTFDERKLLE